MLRCRCIQRRVSLEKHRRQPRTQARPLQVVPVLARAQIKAEMFDGFSSASPKTAAKSSPRWSSRNGLPDVVIPLIHAKVMFPRRADSNPVPPEFLPQHEFHPQAVRRSIVHLHHPADSPVPAVGITAREPVRVVVGPQVHLGIDGEAMRVTGVQVAPGIDGPVARIAENGRVRRIRNNLVPGSGHTPPSGTARAGTCRRRDRTDLHPDWRQFPYWYPAKRIPGRTVAARHWNGRCSRRASLRSCAGSSTTRASPPCDRRRSAPAPVVTSAMF